MAAGWLSATASHACLIIGTVLQEWARNARIMHLLHLTATCDIPGGGCLSAIATSRPADGRLANTCSPRTCAGSSTDRSRRPAPATRSYAAFVAALATIAGVRVPLSERNMRCRAVTPRTHFAPWRSMNVAFVKTARLEQQPRSKLREISKRRRDGRRGGERSGLVTVCGSGPGNRDATGHQHWRLKGTKCFPRVLACRRWVVAWITRRWARLGTTALCVCACD